MFGAIRLTVNYLRDLGRAVSRVFWGHRFLTLHLAFLIRRKSRELVWQAKLELNMPSVKENINELN